MSIATIPESPESTTINPLFQVRAGVDLRHVHDEIFSLIEQSVHVIEPIASEAETAGLFAAISLLNMAADLVNASNHALIRAALQQEARHA